MSGQVKINFAVQLEKLEEVIPDIEDFDFFGVHPALDACMALGSLLQGIQDNDDAQISEDIKKNNTESINVANNTDNEHIDEKNGYESASEYIDDIDSDDEHI